MKNVAIILVLALLAGGAGFAHGAKLFELLGAAKVERADSGREDAARTTAGPATRDLKPIVTNLAAPADAWVRLEATLVCDPSAPIDEKGISEMSNDIVAYLRTTTARQLEGAGGLRRLREELSERMALRSGNRVREVLIQTLVVQ